MCLADIISLLFLLIILLAALIAGSGKTAAFMVPILSQICVRGREIMSQNSVWCKFLPHDAMHPRY